MINVQPTIDAFNDKHEATFAELAEAKGKPADRAAAVRFARAIKKYCGIAPRRARRNGKRVMLYARCHFVNYAKTKARCKDGKDPYAPSYQQLLDKLRWANNKLEYAERELKRRQGADALLGQVKALLASLYLPLAKA